MRGLRRAWIFELTNDMSNTRAAFKRQAKPGLRALIDGARRSGFGRRVRDVRGFAIKFYTEEGNYDLVGNNIPVFLFKTH